MHIEDRRMTFVGMAVKCGLCLSLVAYMLGFLGCMQITGAKKIKMGTWEIEANNGFEAKAGVQQYDFVDDRRGIGSKKPE